MSRQESRLHQMAATADDKDPGGEMLETVALMPTPALAETSRPRSRCLSSLDRWETLDPCAGCGGKLIPLRPLAPTGGSMMEKNSFMAQCLKCGGGTLCIISARYDEEIALVTREAVVAIEANVVIQKALAAIG